MRAQRDGYIVNVSSIGGQIWEPLGSWYHATKWAVEGLSHSVRAEVERFGIKVVIIEPGVIKSEWATISADHLDVVGAASAYGEQSTGMARSLRAANDQKMASGPEVVAKTIGKAVSSAKPRTVYAVGGGAGFILFLARAMSNRGFDKFISKAVGAAK